MTATKPVSSPNEGYETVTDATRLSIDQNVVRTPRACPYQAPCWKFIRAPIARKGFTDEQGKHHRIYMPYICSYSTENDLEQCSHFHKLNEEKANESGSSMPASE